MNFRFLYVVLIISFVTSVASFAQQDSTKKSAEEIINIKELVDQQIREIQATEAAKEKAAKENLASTENIVKENNIKENLETPDIIKIEPNSEEPETASFISVALIFIEKKITSELFISIVTVLVLLSMLFWYKKQSKLQKNKVSVLKQNVRRMREEKIGGLLDNKLSKIRSKLALNPIQLDGRYITAQAKKLSISKGEIHLAAKINLMMRQSL